MIKHISMFKVSEDFVDRKEEIVALICDLLKNLPNQISSIKSCEIKTAISQSTSTENPAKLESYDLIQIITFDSKKTLGEYPLDPAHLKFSIYTDHMLQRVGIIDFEY